MWSCLAIMKYQGSGDTDKDTFVHFLGNVPSQFFLCENFVGKK